MSAPTLYRSTDAGITWPPASFTGAAPPYTYILPIYEILKACLVEGYPGQTAAGWSMLYDDIITGTAPRFALQNAAKSLVWIFEVDASNNLFLIVCEDAPDFDTRLNEWCGDHSESINPSGSKQGFYSYYMFYYSMPWLVVANENGCFMSAWRPGYENGDRSHYDQKYYPALYMGASASRPGGMAAPELGNGIVMGGSDAITPRFGSGTAHAGSFSFTRNSKNEPIGEAFPLRTYWPSYKTVLHGSTFVAGEIYQEYALLPIMVRYGHGSGANKYSEHDWSVPVYQNMFAPPPARVRQLLLDLGTDFREPITISGKQYLLVPSDSASMINYVSLAAEDWGA